MKRLVESIVWSCLLATEQHVWQCKAINNNILSINTYLLLPICVFCGTDENTLFFSINLLIYIFLRSLMPTVSYKYIIWKLTITKYENYIWAVMVLNHKIVIRHAFPININEVRVVPLLVLRIHLLCYDNKCREKK